jgi:hypothetical protein
MVVAYFISHIGNRRTGCGKGFPINIACDGILRFKRVGWLNMPRSPSVGECCMAIKTYGRHNLWNSNRVGSFWPTLLYTCTSKYSNDKWVLHYNYTIPTQLPSIQKKTEKNQKMLYIERSCVSGSEGIISQFRVPPDPGSFDAVSILESTLQKNSGMLSSAFRELYLNPRTPAELVMAKLEF